MNGLIDLRQRHIDARLISISLHLSFFEVVGDLFFFCLFDLNFILVGNDNFRDDWVSVGGLDSMVACVSSRRIVHCVLFWNFIFFLTIRLEKLVKIAVVWDFSCHVASQFVEECLYLLGSFIIFSHVASERVVVGWL